MSATLKKLISIVCPCLNEEENIEELYRCILLNISPLEPRYDFEILFIDNASSDRTVAMIKALIAQDKRIRLIVNTRNFGPLKSPLYGFLQAKGDAVIMLASDLQDPPEVIPQLIEKWEAGFLAVLAVKKRSARPSIMFYLRKLYYRLVTWLSEDQLIHDYNGFGLYDRRFVEAVRSLNDPYPYFRGYVAELGFSRAEVPYVYVDRSRGRSSYNFYRLYDVALLGILAHSKVPLRFVSLLGLVVALLSFFVGIVYVIYKFLCWDSFPVGVPVILVGGSFIAGVQLFCLGIIGEYIGIIYTQTRNRPLVIEKERVNF